MKPTRFEWAAAVALAVAVGWLVVAAATAMATDEDVACGTVWFTDDYYLERWTVDEGASISIVGSFVWIQYAHTPSSEVNIVSLPLEGRESPVTICTTYIAEGTIPNGTDDLRTGTPPPPEGYSQAVEFVEDERVAVTSLAEPHPTILNAWILSNGLVLQ